MKLSSPTVATVLLFALAAPAAAETFTLTTTAGR
jgi:hypothetical protein